jgi:hypothetical protein
MRATHPIVKCFGPWQLVRKREGSATIPLGGDGAGARSIFQWFDSLNGFEPAPWSRRTRSQQSLPLSSDLRMTTHFRCRSQTTQTRRVDSADLE